MKKRKTIRAIFDGLDQLTSEQIKKSDILKSLLKNEVPKAIEDALANKKTFASIFEINSSNNYVELHKHYWVDALTVCLNWYIEDPAEDYEMCIRISKMIETLKNSKK